MGGVSRFVFYKSEAAESVLRKVTIYLFSPPYYSITFYELSKTDFESAYRIKHRKTKDLYKIMIPGPWYSQALLSTFQYASLRNQTRLAHY